MRNTESNKIPHNENSEFRIPSSELPITVAVLTVSDRCSRGQSIDASGPALVEMVRTRLAGLVVATACVPDEIDLIAEQIRRWAGGNVEGRVSRAEGGEVLHSTLDTRHSTLAPDLILTTGGTGLSPRDVTPEATERVLERHHPALLELARLRCYASTPRAFLSRGQAGTIGRTLVINLPGSPAGATACLEAMLDILPHAVETLRGQGQEHNGVKAVRDCGPKFPGENDECRMTNVE